MTFFAKSAVALSDINPVPRGVPRTRLWHELFSRGHVIFSLGALRALSLIGAVYYFYRDARHILRVCRLRFAYIDGEEVALME